MEGHAAHHDRLARRLAALGQRDVEQARGLFGVGIEEFVEVAHPVEEQGVRMVGLEAEVLGHHGRVTGKVRLRNCLVGWAFLSYPVDFIGDLAIHDDLIQLAGT